MRIVWVLVILFTGIIGAGIYFLLAWRSVSADDLIRGFQLYHCAYAHGAIGTRRNSV